MICQPYICIKATSVSAPAASEADLSWATRRPEAGMPLAPKWRQRCRRFPSAPVLSAVHRGDARLSTEASAYRPIVGTPFIREGDKRTSSTYLNLLWPAFTKHRSRRQKLRRRLTMRAGLS